MKNVWIFKVINHVSIIDASWLEDSSLQMQHFRLSKCTEKENYFKNIDGRCLS